MPYMPYMHRLNMVSLHEITEGPLAENILGPGCNEKSGKAKRDYGNTEENLKRNGYFKKLK